MHIDALTVGYGNYYKNPFTEYYNHTIDLHFDGLQQSYYELTTWYVGGAYFLTFSKRKSFNNKIV